MSIFRAMDMAVLVGELVNFCITLKALIIWLVKRRIPNARLMLERSHITPCMNHVSNQMELNITGKWATPLKVRDNFYGRANSLRSPQFKLLVNNTKGSSKFYTMCSLYKYNHMVSVRRNLHSTSRFRTFHTFIFILS